MPPPITYAEVYARQLFKLGHGLPLWEPEPTISGEVLIGDVGYAKDGGFYRIFNTIEPCKDDELPDDFEKFELRGRKETAIQTREAAMNAGVHYGRTIKQYKTHGGASGQALIAEAGIEYSFKCSDDQGAIVYFEYPVDRTILHQKPHSYILQHYDSWGRFAVDECNKDVERDGLWFVRGCIKASTRWAIAAIAEARGGGHFTLHGGAAGAPAGADLSWGFEKNEYSQMSMERRMNPRKYVIGGSTSSIKDGEDEGEIPQGQCFFINYMKMKRRRFWGPKVISAAADPKDLSSEEEDSDSEGPGNAASTSTSEALRQIVERKEVVAGPYERKVWDPVDDILDYIFTFSDAEVAIASDSVLNVLCEIHGEEFPDDIAEFLSKLKPEIVTDEAGFSMLEKENSVFPDLPEQTLDCEPESQPQGSEVDPRSTQPVDVDLPDDSPDDDNPPPSMSEKDDDTTLDKDIARIHGRALILSDVTAHVTILVASPDGHWVLGRMDNRTLALWDASTGARIPLNLHPLDPQCIAFSPDSRLFVSGEEDGQAIVWDVEQQMQRNVLEGHEGRIFSVVFPPEDSTKVATASGDATIRLWDVETGACLRILSDTGAMDTVMAFSDDGKRLAYAGFADGAVIWDLEADKIICRTQGHESVVWCLSFSHDGRRLVTGSDDSTSRLWNADSGEALAVLGECDGPVFAVGFSSDNERVFAVSAMSNAIVYDSYTGEKIYASPNDGMDSRSPTVFSPDGTMIATARGGSTIHVWDAKDGTLVTALKEHVGVVNMLTFTADSQKLLSYGSDDKVVLWTLS